MEDFITGIIAWFVIIAIITMVFRLVKYNSLSDFPIGKVVLWALIIACLAIVPKVISYLIRPSKQEIQQTRLIEQNKFYNELDTI